MEFVRGAGCELFDSEGRAYLDFTAGIAVMALGHGDAGVAAAMRTAIDTGLIHVSNLFRTAPGETTRRAAGGAVVRRSRVLLQFGRRGERGRVQVRAQVGAADGRAQRSTRSSRCAARFTGGCSGRSPRRTGRSIARRSVRWRAASASSSATSTNCSVVLDGERVAALIVEPVQGEGGMRVLDPASCARCARSPRSAASR